MSSVTDVILSSAITVTLAGAVGYGLFRLISPRNEATNSLGLGRRWFAWTAMIVSVATLPPFFRLFDANSIATWLVSLAVFGGLAFGFGWLYGRFFKFNALGNGNSSGPGEAGLQATNETATRDTAPSNLYPDRVRQSSSASWTRELTASIGAPSPAVQAANVQSKATTQDTQREQVTPCTVSAQPLINCSASASTKSDALRDDEVRRDIPSIPMPNLPTSLQPVVSSDEDRLYARVADELESGNTQKGLWTRCYAEAGGNDTQTRVLYIRHRFAQMAADAARKAEQERAEQARTIEQERLLRIAETRQRIRASAKISEYSALAVSTSRDHYVKSAECLLELLGGTITNEVKSRGIFSGRAVRVSLGEDEKSFGSALEFVEWMAREIAPRYLPSKEVIELIETQSAKYFLNYVNLGKVLEVTGMLAKAPLLVMALSDPNLQTPLHIAVCNDHRGMVQLLLDYDAPTNIFDINRETPLALAKQRGDEEIMSILAKADSSRVVAEREALRQGG